MLTALQKRIRLATVESHRQNYFAIAKEQRRRFRNCILFVAIAFCYDNEPSQKPTWPLRKSNNDGILSVTAVAFGYNEPSPSLLATGRQAVTAYTVASHPLTTANLPWKILFMN